MYLEIKRCRICGNANLIPILNLGNQALTGVFFKTKDQAVTSGPLELVKCEEDKDHKHCGLVQLRHSYNPDELYGDSYGYRSGLNKSMVTHLQNKVNKIEKTIDLVQGDLVLDIGSNDGTLLGAYTNKRLILVGIDPIGEKFKEYCPSYIQVIPYFFSAKIIKNYFGNKKAKIITSIAMFYDLQSPIEFMQEIRELLDDNGVWILEQSYLPTMLEMNAYDTICHEHLEYYCLKQLKWMADRVGLKIIDVELNNINGGSFSVTVTKSNSPYYEKGSIVDKILSEEKRRELFELKPYKEFSERVLKHREELVKFIKNERDKNKKFIGYGASTKGNVILQFCNLTEKEIPLIAEVNKDKFGCFTPGTLIPIISEAEARAMKPDYFLVLPWHFKENIIEKEEDYLSAGGKLFFPLPLLEVVSQK
ncbi:MAG: class I SAM-dependent methyltransferase [Candidatus Omnitrophota bacterium]|nr:class I SAM-dependent methyltransferase [Candidatus Omnitrophota bacterium]